MTGSIQTTGTFEVAEQAGGAGTVMNLVVRVSGRVPTRIDVQHAGTAERQLGLTLGAVLIYLDPRELHQASEESAGRLISRVSELRISAAVDTLLAWRFDQARPSGA